MMISGGKVRTERGVETISMKRILVIEATEGRKRKK